MINPINHNTDSKKRLWVLGGYDASYSSHQNEYCTVWHVHLNKAPKKVPEDQMDRIMIQENPKHKKTLKESQKSRLFKVVVNFQPLRKKRKQNK